MAAVFCQVTVQISPPWVFKAEDVGDRNSHGQTEQAYTVPSVMGIYLHPYFGFSAGDKQPTWWGYAPLGSHFRTGFPQITVCCFANLQRFSSPFPFMGVITASHRKLLMSSSGLE